MSVCDDDNNSHNNTENTGELIARQIRSEIQCLHDLYIAFLFKDHGNLQLN